MPMMVQPALAFEKFQLKLIQKILTEKFWVKNFYIKNFSIKPSNWNF